MGGLVFGHREAFASGVDRVPREKNRWVFQVETSGRGGLYVVAFDLGVKRGPADAQECRRLGPLPAGLF